MSLILKPKYFNEKNTRVPVHIFSHQNEWGQEVSILVCKLNVLYFPSGCVSMCGYKSLTTKVAVSRDHWACLSMSQRKCVHLLLCVNVCISILVCLYFIEWILTQGLTSTNQNCLNLFFLQPHPKSSIHLSFPPPFLSSFHWENGNAVNFLAVQFLSIHLSFPRGRQLVTCKPLCKLPLLLRFSLPVFPLRANLNSLSILCHILSCVCYLFI